MKWKGRSRWIPVGKRGPTLVGQAEQNVPYASAVMLEPRKDPEAIAGMEAVEVDATRDDHGQGHCPDLKRHLIPKQGPRQRSRLTSHLNSLSHCHICWTFFGFETIMPRNSK